MSNGIQALMLHLGLARRDAALKFGESVAFAYHAAKMVLALKRQRDRRLWRLQNERDQWVLDNAPQRSPYASPQNSQALAERLRAGEDFLDLGVSVADQQWRSDSGEKLERQAFLLRLQLHL